MAIITPSAAYALVNSAGFELEKLKSVSVSENFTWREVFTNRTLNEVRAAGIEIFNNALRAAQRMEWVRAFLRQKIGKPIIIRVMSWYRSPAANSAAGGATKSQHLLALAVDFIVPGYADKRGNQFIQALLIQQKDIASFCLEITNGNWVHIDLRPERIAFENLGRGRYKVMKPAEILAFVKKYGVAA